ncbi:PEP-CTERM sorting domain-containing protein [Aestuariirhabdus sp. LZHN29]|uniref:PEP-CTERM sorting domain-containing protein n=1 Tax=Aestuariirhabdus sp. LZHN29 TaxID=3417462 RepID=UPI003CECE302
MGIGRVVVSALLGFMLCGQALAVPIVEGSFTSLATEDYEGTAGGRTILNSIFNGNVSVSAGSVTHRSVDQGNWTDFRGGSPIVPHSGTKFGVHFGFGDFTLDFTGLGGIFGFSGWASAAGTGSDVIEFFDLNGNSLQSFADPDGWGPGDGTMEFFSYISTASIGFVRLQGSETTFDDLGYTTRATVQTVPEPETLLLFALGALGVVLRSRHSQANGSRR